jgi:hypothetical protein
VKQKKPAARHIRQRFNLAFCVWAVAMNNNGPHASIIHSLS